MNLITGIETVVCAWLGKTIIPGFQQSEKWVSSDVLLLIPFIELQSECESGDVARH